MLNYSVYGPTASGRWLVTYPTPGCNVPTPVCDCPTDERARLEASRLNREQSEREEAIQRERDLCGFHRIQSGMELI